MENNEVDGIGLAKPSAAELGNTIRYTKVFINELNDF